MIKNNEDPSKSSFPIPANEDERLEKLKEYNILDTLPEKQFDDITRLASLICDTPITLVTLMDKDRQWFKSKQGLEGTETRREFSFCQYTIMSNEIFEVENSLEDERFANNPFVLNDPNVRFYAGAPLITPDGNNLGALCVLDTKPKKLTNAQREALTILANEVVVNMELRRERELIDQERKKATETYELLNAFLEHSPSYISLRSAVDGSYLMVNQATLSNVNRTREEMIGSKLEEIFGQQVADKVLADDREVIRKRKAATMEYVTGEGEDQRYFIRHLFPVFDSNNEVYAVGAISNDITESKETERQMIASNERFSKLFYNSPISMLIGNLDASEFVMVNNTFLQTFGYEEHELVGKKFQDIRFVAFEEDRRMLYEELRDHGRVSNREYTVLKKNGEQIVCLSSIETININGQLQTVSAFQDITVLKKVEKELEHAKRIAEESTLAKSSFLANMSHEIRTPLNALLGFAGILATTELNRTQQEYLEAIDTSGKNLLNIINDILDFSKIEAGMFSIEKTPFSLQQTLHSVNMMFFEKAQSKGLKFFMSIDPETPSLVIGDPTRFTQIMINLIGNALKFTNKGSVTIECDVESKTEKEVIIRIAVTDTGIGISPDKLDSIFNRFTQAEEDTTRNFGGTGLGLSIAKKLVELQDGELWVESKLDEGSVFGFRISYGISESKEYIHQETEKKPPVESKKSFVGKKLLVVEDNLLNQKLATTLLGNEGFEVHVADNGQVAIDILEKESYDLVLMDIQMPVMDGYQTALKMRDVLQLSVPVIAMTANALAGERERCLQAGMNDYITKPFKTQELLDKISQLIA